MRCGGARGQGRQAGCAVLAGTERIGHDLSQESP